jgi:hypothetical protein
MPSNSETDKLHDYTNQIWIAVLDKARAAYNADDSTKATVIAAAKTAAGTDKDALAAITKVESDDTVENAKQTYTALSQLSVSNGTSNFSRTFGFIVDDKTELMDAVEKPAGSRYANSSRVKVEIRCGRDKSNIFSLSAVQIDYVKAPQFIRLTQEQLDSDEDISQVMEFPDYVNQEIVNELVNLVMRKTNDPSLQAHM